MTFDLFQAGAWPIGQSNLPSFSIPQELEKSVQMVSRPLLLKTMVSVVFQNESVSCFSVYLRCLAMISSESHKLFTVESLYFVMAQFSWYSWVAFPHEFTFSTKRNFERGFFFFNETENWHIEKITSPRISKKLKIHENWPKQI